ncbi:MAG TPA: hypothetical protein VKW09_07890 [bacterium]|nr:hypothetical protein [bacterium]
MPNGNTRRERRDTSPAGTWNRAQFEESLKLLRVIGLSARAMEHCQRKARETQLLPHEVLREIFEHAVLIEEAIEWRSMSPARRGD